VKIVFLRFNFSWRRDWSSCLPSFEQCSPVEVHQRYRGVCCLHHQGDDYKAQQSSRQPCPVPCLFLTVHWIPYISSDIKIGKVFFLLYEFNYFSAFYAMELIWVKPTCQGDGRMVDNAFNGVPLIGCETLRYSLEISLLYIAYFTASYVSCVWDIFPLHGYFNSYVQKYI
jgi:hypothetical protein